MSWDGSLDPILLQELLAGGSTTKPAAPLTHYRHCRWSGASCIAHGCPFCWLEDNGRGDCDVCDLLVKPPPYPDADCKNGDDCLICSSCSRCMCKRPVCRECSLCSDHAGFEVDEDGHDIACPHSWWDPVVQSWTVST